VGTMNEHTVQSNEFYASLANSEKCQLITVFWSALPANPTLASKGYPPGQCNVWCSKRDSMQAISWRLKTGTFRL